MSFQRVRHLLEASLHSHELASSAGKRDYDSFLEWVSIRTKLQGHLAHKTTPTPYGPRHSPTIGSWEEAISCERGIPVPYRGEPAQPSADRARMTVF